MKIGLFLTLSCCLSSLDICAQQVIVSDIEYYEPVSNCEPDGKFIYSEFQGDTSCITTYSFKTNIDTVVYYKMYGRKKTLRAEGFVNAWYYESLKAHVFSKNGEWKFYDKNGFLVSTCCYDHDMLCKDCIWKEYDANGNVIKEYHK